MRASFGYEGEKLARRGLDPRLAILNGEKVLFRLLRFGFAVARRHLAQGVVGAAAARVRCEMAEDRPADFAPRREAKSRVGVVECRLNASAFEQIAREVFAARLAHAIGFEERAANAGFRVFAETIPGIGFRLHRSVEQVFQKVFDCVLHVHLTARK